MPQHPAPAREKGQSLFADAHRLLVVRGTRGDRPTRNDRSRGEAPAESAPSTEAAAPEAAATGQEG